MIGSFFNGFDLMLVIDVIYCVLIDPASPSALEKKKTHGDKNRTIFVCKCEISHERQTAAPCCIPVYKWC